MQSSIGPSRPFGYGVVPHVRDRSAALFAGVLWLGLVGAVCGLAGELQPPWLADQNLLPAPVLSPVGSGLSENQVTEPASWCGGSSEGTLQRS